MSRKSLLKTVVRLCRGTPPGQLVIQLTDLCNAACPQCGMRRSAAFPRTRLEMGQCCQIIEQAANRGVQALSLTGGEPLLYLDQVTLLVNHATKAGIPYTRTGTNGFLFARPQAADFTDRVKKTAESLATCKLRNFWISIDSADPDTHERMRGLSCLISGIEKALPIFHAFGLYPTANLGLNRNLAGSSRSLPVLDENSPEEQTAGFAAAAANGLTAFLKQAINLGFTMVNFCYPMSVGSAGGLEPVYAASATDQLVHFSRAEKACLFAAMLQVIPKFRALIRIFSPLSAVDTLARYYRGDSITPFPCLGGREYFFISAKDGQTYPCGYRGRENLGDYRFTSPLRDSNPGCIACDWECFRDPSELLGPMSCALSTPLQLVSKYRRGRNFYRLWLKDLAYYRACSYFDGRIPPDLGRLKHC